MSGQISLYRDEIFNFLRTCTIKFSPFSYIYGQQMVLQYGYTNIEESWNPYYKNMCGEYQSYDTPMYIYSKEDKKEILFEKSLRNTRPRLFEFFKIPSKEHTLLCKKYPNQIHLIKSILYPVDSVQACIDASELSLLAYDDSLLYEYERESMVATLNSFLDYVRSRWWTTEFVYEDLYIHAFHYMLWQALPNVLFAQRLTNIGTAQVHPFHVWEYLISKGMNDYRDTLTSKQSLWLYRNLRWVYKNRGKTETMGYLADNILKEMAITLYGKDMLQQTKNSVATCTTIPEIISLNIRNNAQLDDVSTIEQMNLRLVESGLDHDISNAYVAQQVETYGRTRVNVLPTKLLEMRKNNINTMWEDVLSNFLFESTIYRFICGQIDYSINFTDKSSNTFLQLSMADALSLLYYISCKQNKETPELLPTEMSTYMAYVKEYPIHIPTHFKFLGTRYRISQFIDIDGIMQTIHFTDETFVNQDTFSDYLASQFKSLLRDIRYIRSSGNNLAVRSMEILYKVLRTCKTYPLSNLSTHDNYPDWFNDDDHVGYKSLIDYYENNNLDYGPLVKSLLRVVFPVNEAMASLIGSTEYLDKLYGTLRSLFVQLCSYNVAFIDTARDRNEYIIPTNMKSHAEPAEHNSGTLRYEYDMVVDDSYQGNTPMHIFTDLAIATPQSSKLTSRLYPPNNQLITLYQQLKRTTTINSGISICLISEGTV